MDKDLALFLNIVGVSNKNSLKIMEKFGSYSYLKQNYLLLEKIDNLDKRISKRVINNIEFSLYNYKKSLQDIGGKIVYFGEENYPYNLQFIEDYPLVLYYKGDLYKDDKFGISIVGARKCTGYGAWACKKIAKELSDYGIPIISGLASGIDKISHESSLDNNNRTIAILGNGLDVVYPKNNHNLYGEIVKNGAIITEYPLGTKPLGYNFPYRNRIISGIGQGVVVIEAMEKSGTLITANYGAEQGKEVFALPGNINSLYSKGTNLLIRDGAKIITSIEDILEEITYEEKNMEKIKLSFDSKEQETIFKEILKGPKSVDELVGVTDLKADIINTVLTILELNGYIIEIKGGKFSVI